MVCVDCSCERCERAMREERERFAEKMKQENPDCKKYNLDENGQWGYEVCFCVGCLA
tara:strand:- start:360 stop:530 length:171 start_codon:yes stop_codon:yes gene_type:complete